MNAPGLPLKSLHGVLTHGDPNASVIEWIATRSIDTSRRWSGLGPKPEEEDRLVAAALAHPNLPAERAAFLCGATGARPYHAPGTSGYLSRPDVADEHLHLVGKLSRFHRNPDWFLELVTDPRTTAPVLQRAAAFMDTHGRWNLLTLQTHPNADAETVVACWTHAARLQRDQPLCRASDLFNHTKAKDHVRAIRPEFLRAAFDRIDHPAALLLIAQTIDLGDDPQRLHKLAQHTLLDASLRRPLRIRKLGSTHVFTQVAELIKATGRHHELVAQCVDALEGFTLAGKAPVDALTAGKDQSATRLASVAGRSAKVVVRKAGTDPQTAAGLAAALNDVAATAADPQAALLVLSHLGEHFTGTVAELVAASRSATGS